MLLRQRHNVKHQVNVESLSPDQIKLHEWSATLPANPFQEESKLSVSGFNDYLLRVLEARNKLQDAEQRLP